MVHFAKLTLVSGLYLAFALGAPLARHSNSEDHLAQDLRHDSSLLAAQHTGGPSATPFPSGRAAALAAAIAVPVFPRDDSSNKQAGQADPKTDEMERKDKGSEKTKKKAQWALRAPLPDELPKTPKRNVDKFTVLPPEFEFPSAQRWREAKEAREKREENERAEAAARKEREEREAAESKKREQEEKGAKKKREREEAEALNERQKERKKKKRDLMV